MGRGARKTQRVPLPSKGIIPPTTAPRHARVQVTLGIPFAGQLLDNGQILVLLGDQLQSLQIQIDPNTVAYWRAIVKLCDRAIDEIHADALLENERRDAERKEETD